MVGVRLAIQIMKLRVKKPKRSKWSFKTNFWGAISIVLLVALVVLIFLKKSIWVELEIIVGVISLFIFIYLYYVLYHGIRFDNNEKYTITWKNIDADSLSSATIIDTGFGFTAAGAESGILGLVVGFLLDIIISIVLSLLIAVLLWIGLNFILTAIVVLTIPLFYIFRRSLRYIVAKGRRCYKNSRKSFFFAIKSTIAYTVWLYCLIFLGHYIFKTA
jgi:hypothetical protein